MKYVYSIFIVLIFFTLNSFAQVLNDYRSIATGNWGTAATWETYNGSAWVPAAAGPTAATANTITIQSPHLVTVAAAVTIDQVVVNAGASLQNNAGIVITIANSGIVGSELVVDGTFIENGSTSLAWGGGATWNLGATGTYVKTGNTSSNNWQNNYQGGIATIPATSNWILRKIGAPAPQLTTIGAFYGNLTIENIAGGTWVTSAGSTFQGAGGFPTIKGTLDIGGALGAGNVFFFNQHINVQPTLVLGNMIVRAGSVFANNGTGLEIQGNMNIPGQIIYDSCDPRRLVFSGGNAQSLTCTGLTMVWDLTMNKSANSLTLNSPIQVDNLATFTNGVINTTNVNLLSFYDYATVTGANNNSYVNGPVRRHGPTGFTYPVGKGGAYRPIIIGNSLVNPIFWTEAFQNGCASLCLASAYVGPNGAWTITNGANGTAPNEWFVSGAECGNANGSCGSACGAVDPSLHIGNVATSTLSCSACPTGDCGAAYDANSSGGLACILCPATCNNTITTNKRIESPTINCTGKSNVTVKFNYIENGSGTNDNASLYYFDGVTWSLVVDMPKTAVGNCGGSQHCWTPYIATLPASAANNPNVKIGFLWVNNADGVGGDPSFAVDDIQVFEFNNSQFIAEYFPTNPQVPYGNVLVPSLTAISNCEYWILNRAVGTDSRTVGLTWNAASCNNTAFASFEVARYDGISTWQDHNGTVVGTAAGGTVTTPAPTANFGPFAIAYVPLPLPVELAHFNGTCDDGKVTLTWQTTSETNNDYFTIEKSDDMVNWTELRTLNGAGNSNVNQYYEMEDLYPYLTTYYRLSQTDLNGQVEYFEPISVLCNQVNEEIRIYPNPSDGIVHISIPTGSVLQTIEVYTSMGQQAMVINTGEVKGSMVQVTDLSTLSAGTYYLRLRVNNDWITKPVNILK
jgi:hypothetical protein